LYDRQILYGRGTAVIAHGLDYPQRHTSSMLSFSNTKTRHRLNRAALQLNDGFSVVAPISVTIPFCDWPRKEQLS
jgi:hypothetical protein